MVHEPPTPTESLRRHIGLAVVVAAGLTAGIVLNHGLFAIGLAVALAAAWRWGGFAPVFAICVGVIALGSSSYPGLKEVGLDERWVALGSLSAWPLVSGRFPVLPRSKIAFYSALGVIALAFLSTFWSPLQLLTLERSCVLLVLLWVGLIVVPTHAQEDRERTDLARWLALLVVLGAITALVTGIFDRPTAVQESVDGSNLRGWLENQNTIGIWCIALAPAVLALPKRYLTVLALLPILTVVVLSQSRAAFFIALALIVATLIIITHSGHRRYTVIALLLLSVALTAIAQIDGLRQHTALAKFDNRINVVEAVTGGRSTAWSVTLEIIEEKPLLGYGYGSGDRIFAIAGIPQKQLNFFNGSNPNNAYLQQAFELGVTGLLLLFLLFLGWSVSAIRQLRNPTVLPFFLITVVLVATGLTESIFFSPGNPFGILLWSSIGTVIGGRR